MNNPTSSAAQHSARTGGVTPKSTARQGVLSAVRPDPQRDAGREPERVFYGLHIVAAPKWRISVSATCPCGYRRQVKGHAAVLRIIDDYTGHKKTCPHHTGIERRNAA